MWALEFALCDLGRNGTLACTGGSVAIPAWSRDATALRKGADDAPGRALDANSAVPIVRGSASGAER